VDLPKEEGGGSGRKREGVLKYPLSAIRYPLCPRWHGRDGIIILSWHRSAKGKANAKMQKMQRTRKRGEERGERRDERREERESSGEKNGERRTEKPRSGSGERGVESRDERVDDRERRVETMNAPF
jgi:hypothetical protein